MLSRRKLIGGAASSLLLPSRKLFAAPPLISKVCCSPSLPSQFVVPNGLVGYWGLDSDCLDFNHNLAFDLSGYGSNGSIIGSPTLAPGQVGTALSFTGSSDQKVTIPFNSLLNIAMPITISAWVYYNTTNDASGIRGIISKYNTSGGNEFSFRLLGSGGVTNKLNFGGSTTILAPNPFPMQQWIFASTTVNASGNCVLYQNAVSVASGAVAISTGTDNVIIGEDFNTSARVWIGSIDDVCIWNRALDPWEITAKYQAGLQGSRNAPVNLSLPPN